MLTVATYFWAPDDGSKFAAAYTADDVRRLQRQVKQYLATPHEFAVITDRPHVFDGDKDIRAIPIDRTKHVPGTCFARLMTFHPDGMGIFGERVLQIDLDTLVVGSMDALVDRDEDLVMWRNPSRIPWDNPAVSGRPYYNTSMLLHRCGTKPTLWLKFDPKNPKWRDDQWYLSDRLGHDAPYWDESHGVYRLGRSDTPGSGVNGELPANACIVTFPGSNGKWTLPHVAQANPWIWAHLMVVA